MNISDIDTRDFNNIPRDEARRKISHVLLFLADNFDENLSQDEMKKLSELAKKISE